MKYKKTKFDVDQADVTTADAASVRENSEVRSIPPVVSQGIGLLVSLVRANSKPYKISFTTMTEVLVPFVKII